MVSFCRHFAFLIPLIVLLSLILSSCNKIDIATSDPVPSCNDSIQNQGEIEIDCGGPCPPCLARMTALVDGQLWQSAGGVSSTITNNNILISAGNGVSTMSLIYTGPFVNGTFNLSGALYSTSSPAANYTANSGSITFIDWNSQLNQVSGFFSFKAFESSGNGDSVVVSQGKFSFVSY